MTKEIPAYYIFAKTPNSSKIYVTIFDDLKAEIVSILL